MLQALLASFAYLGFWQSTSLFVTRGFRVQRKATTEAHEFIAFTGPVHTCWHGTLRS